MYVFLTGPPGAGKSVVAPLLATKMGARGVDLDRVIERRAGKSVARVFAEDGEPRFRELERDALATLRDTVAWTIVAAGGGSVVDPANRERMRALGVIVRLGGRLSTLVGRTREGRRPLLAGDRESRLRAVLAARRAAYADADLRVATDGRTPERVAEAVAVGLRSLGVTVRVGTDAPYAVRVRAGALADVGSVARATAPGGRVTVITDPLVARRHGRAVLTALRRAGLDAAATQVPPGESAKSPAVLARVWRALARRRLGRDDAVIGLGGGSITDLAGFAAATYARGVAWLAVPTTLLAMVDAALGGKTAIDLPEGKNLAGAFHDPRAVLEDVDVLESLPRRELRGGLAEVVKTAVLGDGGFFAQLERAAPLLREGDPTALFAAIAASVEVKGSVVTADPREARERLSLNLGHTFGHALESATGYRGFTHGEAVALGVVFACALANELGLCGLELTERVEALLAEIGLPTRCRIPSGLWSMTQADKKRAGGAMRWVLPRRLGTVSVVADVPERALRGAARRLTG